MSNYRALAYHPITGKTETASFIDGHFGPHRYGVQFPDGRVFRAYEVSVPSQTATDAAAKEHRP